MLSVDTEEEWDWSGDFPHENFSVRNIQLVPEFQGLCDRYGIRPTYFVDYAVAENEETAAILKALATTNKCEIGAHLHPWCNPPYYGKTGEKESHIVNLPVHQVEAKLDSLIELLSDVFGVMPSAFRSGRWGINGNILNLLKLRGFEVDSSMYPYFKNEYFDCEHTSLFPYWPDYDTPTAPGSQRNILEIPVTVGFNRRCFPLMNSIYNATAHPLLRYLRLTGLFWHTRVLRKLHLTPEATSGENMQLLIDSALENQLPVLHMYMHSSSLVDGVTGYMKQKNAFDVICRNIEMAVEYALSRSSIKFCTISEAAVLLKNRIN